MARQTRVTEVQPDVFVETPAAAEASYRCVRPATGLEVGGSYTATQIEALPGMGGVGRLLRKGSIVAVVAASAQ